MSIPAPTTTPPSESALLADLERWRRHGALKLRQLRLPALSRAAMAAGLADSVRTAAEPALLKDLVRTALAPISGSQSGRCAVVLLGLDPNTFDLAPHLLREETADIYGVSLERFRREPQKQVLTVVASQILEMCHAHRARLERLAMEQRHPADSRLAIKWLERFEAYFSMWTPAYGLGADLSAYRATLLDPHRPYDSPPGTEDPADRGYTQELQAEGYGRFALFHYAALAAAKQRWLVRYGGLWLLSSAQAEAEARDALDAIRLDTPINERDESRLRLWLEAVGGELEHFFDGLSDGQLGWRLHREWQSWLSSCGCGWQAAAEAPDVEYFPTGRYHSGIEPGCGVHRTVEACNRFCTIIEGEWIKVADWYQTSSGQYGTAGL